MISLMWSKLLRFTIFKCDWGQYWDYRIIVSLLFKPIGHVRITFYSGHKVCISDLFVDKSFRRKHIGTALLNKADFIINKVDSKHRIYICPVNEWVRNWYIKRNYIIQH